MTEGHTLVTKLRQAAVLVRDAADVLSQSLVRRDQAEADLAAAVRARAEVAGALLDAGTVPVGADLAVAVRRLTAERDAAIRERDAARGQRRMGAG